MKSAYGRGRFARIGNLLFQRTLRIENMTSNDLGLGLGYNPKPPSPTASAKQQAKKSYQNSVEAYKEEQK